MSARVEFHTGAGWTVPTQLVFVPMLFVLPRPTSRPSSPPGCCSPRRPSTPGARCAPSAPCCAFGDSWYSIGPAVVISLAGAEVPEWSDWPLFLVALGSQLGIDAAISMLRARFGLGVPILPT